MTVYQELVIVFVVVFLAFVWACWPWIQDGE